MAVWRCNPQKKVLVYLGQVVNIKSHGWKSFLKSHGLGGARAVAVNVTIKREISCRDTFNDIEMFYNSKRQHGSNDQIQQMENVN